MRRLASASHFSVVHRCVAVLWISLAASTAAAAEDEEIIDVEVNRPAPAVELSPEEDDDEVVDVVVTGTRTEKRADDTPVRTLVVRRELLERRQSRALADALQYVSGVRVENNCQNCGFTQLRLNGLEGPYTQVLIDGLPSYSALTGVYGLEQLPTEMIEQVEVVKGGGSSLYGPGAIAGVVNLVTRRPDRDYASFRLQQDGVGLRTPAWRATANGGATIAGGHGFHGFASALRQEGYDRDGDGYTELVQLRSLAGGGQLYLTPFDDTELRLGLIGLTESRRGGDALDVPPHEAELAEQINTRRIQADLRFRHEVGPAVAYRLAYGLAYTDRDAYYGGGGASSRRTLEALGPPRSDWTEEQFARFERAREAREVALNAYGQTKNLLHVADAAVDIRYTAAGAQVLTVGVQGQADQVEDRYLGYDRVIDDTFGYVGGYLQHDWVFASWGESVVGIRVDKHTQLDNPVASPRAALMFRPHDALRLRSSFATGFRAPQAFDEDLHIESVAGAPRIIRNAPGLKPEYGMSFAQQIETQLEIPGGVRLRASLNGYYQRLRDAFVLDTEDVAGTPELEVVRVNRGLTQVYGGELTLRAAYRDHVTLRGGFTLENAVNDEPDPDFGQTRIFRTPRAYGYAELLFTYDGVEAQAGLDVTGPMMVPHYDADGTPRVDEIENTSPWFADVALNFAYRIDAGGYFLRPYVGIVNVFDAYQSDFDRGPTRDVGYIYGPRFPRTLRAGMEAGF